MLAGPDAQARAAARTGKPPARSPSTTRHSATGTSTGSAQTPPGLSSTQGRHMPPPTAARLAALPQPTPTSASRLAAISPCIKLQSPLHKAMVALATPNANAPLRLQHRRHITRQPHRMITLPERRLKTPTHTHTANKRHSSLPHTVDLQRFLRKKVDRSSGKTHYMRLQISSARPDRGMLSLVIISSPVGLPRHPTLHQPTPTPKEKTLIPLDRNTMWKLLIKTLTTTRTSTTTPNPAT